MKPLVRGAGDRPGRDPGQLVPRRPAADDVHQGQPEQPRVRQPAPHRGDVARPVRLGLPREGLRRLHVHDPPGRLRPAAGAADARAADRAHQLPRRRALGDLRRDRRGLPRPRRPRTEPISSPASAGEDHDQMHLPDEHAPTRPLAGRARPPSRAASAAPVTPRDPPRQRHRAVRVDRRRLRLRPLRHPAAGIQVDFGWTGSTASACRHPRRVGTAVVAFGVGPVVDRLGRRKG